MGRTLITRSKKIGTSAEPGAGAGFQFYNGAGKLLALVVDFSASADAGTVLTAYDGNDTTGPVIYTQTGNTDLGTTVPVFIGGDADIVAGTSTGGVSNGVIFTQGLFFNCTVDVAGPQVVTAFIRPLIKKTVEVATTGSAGSATGAASIFYGPGLWHGYAVTLDSQSPPTLDITFKDSPIAAAGNTVMTKTNYVITPGVKTIRAVATTTGEDEAGATITTAATGVYMNHGIYLTTGLNVNLAQGNALNRAARFECLFDN